MAMKQWMGALAVVVVLSAHAHANSWQIESLATPANENRIALDPSGQPHIVYESGPTLHHIAWTGSGWHDDGVSSGDVHSPRIAIGADGTVHVAYSIWWQQTHVLNQMWHASFDGTAWAKEMVGDWTGRLSLALDASGEPHISNDVDSMVFDAQGTAHYARTNWLGGANWEIRYGVSGQAEVVVRNVDGAPLDLKLAVDSAGIAHLTYHTGGDALYYVFGREASWTYEKISGGVAGAFTGLAVDEAGTPHVSFEYCHGPSSPEKPKELWYGVRKDGVWYMETIDTAENLYPGGGMPNIRCGQSTDLVLDSLGRAYISYDFWNGTGAPELRYAAGPEPAPPPVPEPLTILSAFLGTAALGGYIRRRLREARAEIACG